MRFMSRRRDQCCQKYFFQNRGLWRFFAKNGQFIATTPVLLHFYVIMEWSKIAKWPNLAILAIFWASKIAELAINRGVWQH